MAQSAESKSRRYRGMVPTYNLRQLADAYAEQQRLMYSGTRIEGRMGGYRLGMDFGKTEKKATKELAAQPQPLKMEARPKITYEHEEEEEEEEKLYDVKGREETTPYSLRLESLEVKGEKMEFTGSASGIFTPSSNPLQHARLRTKDLQALRSRGTLFYFDFRPTRFEVRFYDPDNTDSPLGVLHADSVAPAGNPGCGAGKWLRL